MMYFARLLGLLSAVIAVVVVRPVNSYQGFMIIIDPRPRRPTRSPSSAPSRRRSASATDHRSRSRRARPGRPWRRLHPSRAVDHDGLEHAFGADWERAGSRRGASDTLSVVAGRGACHGCRSRRGPDVPFATIPGTDPPAARRYLGAGSRRRRGPARRSSTSSADRGISSTRTC